MDNMNSRPKWTDQEVVTKAAKKLCEKLANEFEDFGVQYEEDEEGILQQVVDAIMYEDDGYCICRRLDSDGWDVDEDWVRVCSDTRIFKLNVLRDMVQAWVKETGVKSALKVGDRVLFNDRGDKESSGLIKAIDEANGRYLIFSEALGHKETGYGTRGVYRDFEECRVQEVIT